MPLLQKQLRALADETRREIVKLLLTHDYCVGALAHNLGISGAAVSQHLRLLREAGLVKGEKRGYWTHYNGGKGDPHCPGEGADKTRYRKAVAAPSLPQGDSPGRYGVPRLPLLPRMSNPPTGNGEI